MRFANNFLITCHLIVVMPFEDSVCTPTTSLSWKVSPYLFPCTIEYSLIAAAVLYKICSNMGRHVSPDTSLVEHVEADAVECHKVYYVYTVNGDVLLWTPAQRKRASMLYFANVLFIYLWPPYSPALVNGSSRKF